eukprot:Nk52_evm81s62 gene=Nk52_evmTU81s62
MMSENEQFISPENLGWFESFDAMSVSYYVILVLCFAALGAVSFQLREFAESSKRRKSVLKEDLIKAAQSINKGSQHASKERVVERAVERKAFKTKEKAKKVLTMNLHKTVRNPSPSPALRRPLSPSTRRVGLDNKEEGLQKTKSTMGAQKEASKKSPESSKKNVGLANSSVEGRPESTVLSGLYDSVLNKAKGLKESYLAHRGSDYDFEEENNNHTAQDNVESSRSKSFDGKPTGAELYLKGKAMGHRAQRSLSSPIASSNASMHGHSSSLLDDIEVENMNVEKLLKGCEDGITGIVAAIKHRGTGKYISLGEKKAAQLASPTVDAHCIFRLIKSSTVKFMFLGLKTGRFIGMSRGTHIMKGVKDMEPRNGFTVEFLTPEEDGYVEGEYVFRLFNPYVNLNHGKYVKVTSKGQTAGDKIASFLGIKKKDKNKGNEEKEEMGNRRRASRTSLDDDCVSVESFYVPPSPKFNHTEQTVGRGNRRLSQSHGDIATIKPDDSQVSLIIHAPSEDDLVPSRDELSKVEVSNSQILRSLSNSHLAPVGNDTQTDEASREETEYNILATSSQKNAALFSLKVFKVMKERKTRAASKGEAESVIERISDVGNTRTIVSLKHALTDNYVCICKGSISTNCKERMLGTQFQLHRTKDGKCGFLSLKTGKFLGFNILQKVVCEVPWWNPAEKFQLYWDSNHSSVRLFNSFAQFGKGRWLNVDTSKPSFPLDSSLNPNDAGAFVIEIVSTGEELSTQVEQYLPPKCDATRDLAEDSLRKSSV